MRRGEASPCRIAVVGNSGSGKTTLARKLASRLDLQHIELDSIHHLPGWTRIEREAMRRIVSERIALSPWVVDGNYGSWVQDLVFAKADTVVWLDLPRHVIMRSVIRRTLGRGILRRELWNGNREALRNLFKRKPEDNIVLWAWSQHEAYRKRYLELMDSPATQDPSWVRIRSRAQLDRWVESLA